MFFSVVVPVYNRADEVDELLDSLTKQTFSNFEVIIVEDGSTVTCENVVDKYKSILDVKYLFKSNSGPGLSRNYGVEHSKGDYIVIFDSDCIIPPDYMKTVNDYLEKKLVDAYGGPDRAHESFSDIQKSINYSMTSFFTTGGIRGGKKRLDKYHPRSYNLGVNKSVFQKLNGFSNMRFGEDMDFCIRLFNNGYNAVLIQEAWVYHKRRVDFKKFFKQVFNSGIARINLLKRHPGSMKLVHLLPTCFSLGVIALILLSIFVSSYFVLPILLYCLLIFIDASIKEKSIKIGIISIFSSFIQLFGYGLGFINAVWNRYILKKPEYGAYTQTFYK